MSKLIDVNVVTTIGATDYVYINNGRKTNQVLASTLLADASGYSIEQVTATADYTLTSSTANEVWVFLDGDELTLPNDSNITTGTKYVVFNSSTTTDSIINIASGATCPLVLDGSSYISSAVADNAYQCGRFYKTGASTWVAEGDITAAA